MNVFYRTSNNFNLLPKLFFLVFQEVFHVCVLLCPKLLYFLKVLALELIYLEEVLLSDRFPDLAPFPVLTHGAELPHFFGLMFEIAPVFGYL